jgi:energy-coupling factor transporter ATP-binding protein EcfA2
LEKAVQPKAIEALTQGKTIIMIAHRLKTVKSTDQSIVINQGKISQQGTHDDLIRQSGIYADFVGMREKAIPLVLGIRGGIPFMLFLPNALDYLFYAWFEISKNGIDRTSHGMIFCMKLEIAN